MADHDESTQESSKSVYEYIEKHYKAAWSQKDSDDEKSSWLVDCGIVAETPWEQFESMYRASYTEYLAIYMSDSEFQARLIEESQKMNEYYEIHDTPEEERIDVFTDMETRERIQKEMEEYAHSQASDSAALEAFNNMGQGPLSMDDATRISETETAMKESAKAKNEETIKELEEALKEKASQNPEYLVRGAPLRCSYGSHMRYLDMLKTHGVYLDDKPIMHEKDCVVGENIMSFGICNSPTCTLTERESFLVGAETDQDGNYLQSPDDRVITGMICKPSIIGETWQNSKIDTMIAQNATSATTAPNQCLNYRAITTASYLLCDQGGLIFPLNSGQLKHSTYTAPFMNYPHAGNGSAEEEQQAFEKWCEKYDICPYYPGTDEYMGWYQEKIDGLKESNASKKKMKATYEECLDNAYLYGLDRMGEERRSQVRDMVSQYLDAGLLNEKDALEVQNKYSGLRLDFGYNAQKNLANATPEEDAFYQYYGEKARAFAEKREELFEEAGNALNQSDVACIAAALKELWEDEQEVYDRFEREIGRYEGYLSEERKGQIEELKDLFGQ